MLGDSWTEGEIFPQGSRWDVEFFYGHAWTPESPQTDSHLCSIDHIFSWHSVIPSNLPKCFGLPYFYDPSSKKGSGGEWVSMTALRRKWWRVFISGIRGGGISSNTLWRNSNGLDYSSGVLEASSFGKVDDDQELRTPLSPWFYILLVI